MSTKHQYLKVFSVLSLLLVLILIFPGITDALTQQPGEKYDMEEIPPNNQKELLEFGLMSNDKVIEQLEKAYDPVYSSNPLKSEGGAQQEYYLHNNSSNEDQFTKEDYIIKLEEIENYPNGSYENHYIEKFELNDLVIETNDNEKFEKDEPIFKDVDGNFHLTQADYISKNGSIKIRSMAKTNTTYFNVNDNTEQYNGSQAIVSLNSEGQIETGPLDSGKTKILLRGYAPLKGLDKTPKPNFAFNLSSSERLVNENNAIFESNLQDEFQSGGLDKGDTQILRPGMANLENFGTNNTFHIDSIDSTNDQYNSDEVIINDSNVGVVGAIDHTDNIVKSGKGLTTQFEKNVSTFGTGTVYIGNSSGDQVFDKNEFLYAESGAGEGYQPNEDIVIADPNDLDLSTPFDSSGDYNSLNGTEESNLMFLDLNKSGKLDISSNAGSKGGSEPVLTTKTGILEEGKNITVEDQFIEAAPENDSYKTIGGNWTSEPNFQDLNGTKGPQQGDSLKYIPSSVQKSGEYKIGEIIIEDSKEEYVLERSDSVIVGGEINNSTYEPIPDKYHYLDANNTGTFEEYEPIIDAEVDSSLKNSDVIVYSGYLNTTNGFSEDIEYLDQDGNSKYSENEAIIRSKSPGNDIIEYEDEILNTKSNPGKVDITYLDVYPSDLNEERQVYLSKQESGSYKRSNPIVELTPQTNLEDPSLLENRRLLDFSDNTGYVDSNLDGVLNENDAIYREKDTQSVGSDTFGDRLTAVTVHTNGTLSETHIKSVSLETNNTTLATASGPTPNGSWVLKPDADTAWFGPGNASTEFSLHATVTADAPGGETVALEVPQVSDADGDGAYDPGDTGLFLEQDAPRGGLGPGATLTVEQTTEQSDQSDSPTSVALSLQAVETNVSATADGIPVTVRGSDSERDLEATLEYVDNGTVAQSRSGELDATGTAEFAFEAVPGHYQIRVTAVETNDSARSESITVEHPARIHFANRTAAVQRGEPAPFEIDLEHTDSARIRLESPDGSVLENVRLAAGNQSPPYEIQVLTSGRDTVRSGSGYHLEPNDTPTRANQWISAVEQAPRKGPPADPGASPSTESRSAQVNASRSAQSSETTASTANDPDTGSSNGSGNTPTNGSAVGTSNGTDPSKSDSKSPEPVGGGALAAGDYTLILTGPDNQRATAVFQVRADWSASVETLVAPRDVTLAGPSAVRTHASREDEVAVGDRLVVAVNTSGLGMFTRNISVGGPPPHAKNSNNATQTSPAIPAGENDTEETPSAFVSVGPDHKAESGTQTPPGLKRIETANPNQFYVVAEAGGETVRPGSALETAVVLTEQTPFVPRDNGNRSAEISGQAAMNVIEAQAALGGVSENGTLDLPARDTVPINGTTTVAPGTTATVHIDGANDSFTTHMDVTVDEDGTYETTADLSDYESGTEYTVSVTADGDQLSPVHSGQFLDTRSGTNAASGGGGGGQWQSGSSETGTESVQTETPSSSTTTGPADSLPEPNPQLPTEAIQRAWSAVPEPLRIGPTQMLLIALGSLALLAVGLGIRRLVRP